MAKYNVWVDPAAAAAAAQQRSIADNYLKPIADSLDTHSRLTDIGNNLLNSFQRGDVGGTMFGNAVRTDAARRKNALDTSYGIASRARQMSGPGANGDLVYKRMLDRQKSQVDDDASDRIATALPSWVMQSGAMSQTDHGLAMDRMGAYGNLANAYGNAYQTQAAGTKVTEKKGFWGGLLDTIGTLSGAFKNVAGGVAALSDERAKNINGEVDPDESWEIIKQLGAKSYAYKPEIDPSEKPQVGMVAQDVEKVAPEAVEQGADGLKRVDYAPLIAHTVNALKKMAEEQESVKNDVAMLKQLLLAKSTQR